MSLAQQYRRSGDYSGRSIATKAEPELIAPKTALDPMAQNPEPHDRLREEAHAATRKVADVFSYITDCVFEVDRNWRITFMNERARIEVSQGHDQVGQFLWDAYPETAGNRFREATQRALTEKVSVEHEDYSPSHSKWYRMRAFPSREGLAIYLTDVTERRRLQADLNLQRAVMEAIIESTPDPIFTKDREGRYITMNSAAAQVSGRERDAVAGLMDEDIFPPEVAKDIRDKDIRIMLAGKTQVTEERMPDHHLGEERVYLTTRTPLRDSEGDIMGIIGISRDITERKTTEEKLRQAKEEAERADRVKSKFLAAASHDLRQPLQSLILFAAALNSHVQSPRGRQALEHLESGLGVLKSLLDGILDISKLDAGVVKPDIKAFSIRTLLDEIAGTYAPIATDRGLQWWTEPCQATVLSDPVLLGRILRNLVDNALRYTPRGFVGIACRQLAGQLRIEVEDTGIGIPPEHLETIFDDFHQIGNHARDRTQGLGLGLAIARRTTDLLGLRIAATSQPGMGSTFSIEVPLAWQDEVAASPISDTTHPDGRGRMIALVDDDALVLSSLEAILTDWGFETLAAGGIQEVLTLLGEQERQPDLIISDYRLQDSRTGIEVVFAIRSLFDQTIPGIILTGETNTEFLVKAAAYQGLGIAHKPVTTSQLSEIINRQMGTRKPEREGIRMPAFDLSPADPL